MRRRVLAAGTILLAAAAALAAGTIGGGGSPAAAPAPPPHIKHVFVIVLENENAADTFSANPPAPYLGRTMVAQGAFVPNYFGIGHQSLDNYIAMVSGQPPNPDTQADCQVFSNFTALSTREDGVAIGQGCVYPRSVQTVANQLETSGHSWRGYMEDMGNSVASGEPATCRHPQIGAPDSTQVAEASDQYAARHDPFVYFHSIIDFETCNRNVVDLNALPTDLASAATTPEYSFITPDLCADGHDEFCADGTSPGSFVGINGFLSEWVPRIEASPAFRDHGALLVTFDESESGAEACCGEANGPNSPNNGGTMPGAGGGRIGAVVVSPCITPGTVTQTAYNHYSFLRWVEDDFGLAPLGEASAAGLEPFGSDVFTNPACNTTFATTGGPAAGGGGGGTETRLVAKPRAVSEGRRRIFRFHLISADASCRAGAVVRFGGHEVQTNKRGRARMKLRPDQAGTMQAIARHAGCPTARAKVRVRAVGTARS